MLKSLGLALQPSLDQSESGSESAGGEFGSVLAAGVRRREVLAWALYDFANSGYATVVLTAVYNVFFVDVIAGGASWATLAWTAALSFSSLVALMMAPALGAWADANRGKKRLLALSTAGCVLATAALALPGQGEVWFAAALIVISNVSFSLAEGLIAAFLPELAQPAALGRVSGWGWSFGYFGGMLTLGASLVVVLHAQALHQPATTYVPQTMFIVAGVFALASVPTFVWLRERGIDLVVDAKPKARISIKRAAAAFFSTLRQFPDFAALLACAVFYQAGIAVVIALAAVYAQAVMNFDMTQTMMLVFTVNIAAAIGAFGFGHVQDRVGHRLALALTIMAWIGMVLIAAFTSSLELFWFAASLAGLAMGSSQSCGRALTGLLAPQKRVAEFFGLWTVAVRVASIIGPITYGLVTWATNGDHRRAILATGGFFVVGLILLFRVNVQRGQSTALAGPRWQS
jgi:UMF1 family MFS transporter